MIRHVYIVDDDEPVRASLHALLGTRSDTVIGSFASGDSFLRGLGERESGVVLLDMHMPGTAGMDVLHSIVQAPTRHETIIITGQGNIAMAVEAMRTGAFDFLEKPYDHRTLLAVMERAFLRLESAVQDRAAADFARAQLALLSGRERDVLMRMIDGRANKLIAHELNISPRTVEYYRANVMAKLGVRSLPEALRIAFAGGMLNEQESAAK
jgi:two-component system response regulator FixJ